MSVKKPLTCLFRHNSETPEGKYLVKRRDGTVVEWPSFVLGARDADAETCLRVYGLLKSLPSRERNRFLLDLSIRLTAARAAPDTQNVEYFDSVQRFADEWAKYRAEHGDGDPLMGPHRRDDPATIAEMRGAVSG